MNSFLSDFLNMTNDDFNIIAVDWSYYTMIYLEVEEKTKAVGELIGNFIDYLIREGVPLSAIHCIGHSLGAHACGFAGSNVKSGQIAHITGKHVLPNMCRLKSVFKLNIMVGDRSLCFNSGYIFSFIQD